MSDTNNTPDFTLYNQFLKSINTKLDEAITKQFENKNTGNKMNFTDIKNLLEQADTAALNVENMVAGLSNDAITYEVIKAEIDRAMQEIKGKINNFKNNVVTEKKDKSKLNSIVEANIDKGKTSKALDAFAELHKEDGKLKRDDLEDRIKSAETEYKVATEALAQREDYDNAIESYTKANPSQSEADAKNAIKDEFENLKTANENWKKEVKRLDRIKHYKYEDELEALIKFARDVQDNENFVMDDLKQRFNFFKGRVKLFSKDTISKYFNNIDPNKNTIDDIITILDSFRSVKLQDEDEKKDPKKVLESIQNDYKKLVNGTEVNGVTLTYIFEAFPDMQDEILRKIEAGKTGDIKEILGKTEKMLQKFSEKDKKDLKLEERDAWIKKSKYESENEEIKHNSNPDAPQEEPQAPEDAVTDELDLTDLVGEDFKLTFDCEVDDEDNTIKFDFSSIDREDKETIEAWGEAAYDKLRENPIEHRKAIEKLLPTVPKKFSIPILGSLWNKVKRKMNWKTSEEKRTEKAIKDVLKQKIEERIAKGEEVAQYTEDRRAYQNNFELNKKEKDKFNQEMAKIIAEYAKKGKDMNDEQIQKNMKKEAEDKVLDRDD